MEAWQYGINAIQTLLPTMPLHQIFGDLTKKTMMDIQEKNTMRNSISN
jgi:hypothetical protein